MTASTTQASFDIGRVIERTFKTIGSNFVSFLILSLVVQAIPALIVNLLQLSASPAFREPGSVPTYSPLGSLIGLLGMIVTVVTSFLVQAALIRGTFSSLNGKRSTLGQLMSTAVQFILPLFGLAIVMGVSVLVASIFLLIPGLFLLTIWLVSGPAIVVERKGVFEALGRSAELTKGSRWPIFGLIVIFVVAVWVVEMVLSVGMIGSLMGGGATTMMAVALVFGAFLGALISMVTSVGVASIYYELRNIRDGVGANTLAAVFD